MDKFENRFVVNNEKIKNKNFEVISQKEIDFCLEEARKRISLPDVEK